MNIKVAAFTVSEKSSNIWFSWYSYIIMSKRQNKLSNKLYIFLSETTVVPTKSDSDVMFVYNG